jgi:hypothetical protein
VTNHMKLRNRENAGRNRLIAAHHAIQSAIEPPEKC